MLRESFCLAIVSCIFIYACESARILAVFPTPSISHQIVYRKLTVELSKRGHEFIIFTSDPINDPSLKNYTEIDMHRNYDVMHNLTSYGNDPWSFWAAWSGASEIISDNILSSPEMQRILKPDSNEHFDLILLEYLNFYSIFGLASRFKAPVVGILSVAFLPTLHQLIGNPSALAYAPGLFDAATDDLDFWGRLYIAYRNIRFQLTDYYYMQPSQDKLLKKHFGQNMPLAYDLAKDVDLVLVNEQLALSYPRPSLPLVVRIGGIALDRSLTKLDTELKSFLDGAVNGFVYFSLGSNMKSKYLTAQKLDALKTAFAEIPYRVLWKWELDTLPGKPKNVFISKWLPQNNVLAHPNIKVFVYQGGLQSTEEAINNAVPLVGLPVWNDQEYFVRKIVSVKLGKRVDFQSFDKDDIKKAIMEVATDRGYKERMTKHRDLMNDEPQTALERAIWWTEHVIRQNGTPHLRTRVRHMTWYQRELLDVLLFVLGVVFLICFAMYRLLCFVFNRSYLLINHSANFKKKSA